jgi:hypothetical protein
VRHLDRQLAHEEGGRVRGFVDALGGRLARAVAGRTSMRIRVGLSQACTRCSAAANLKLCAGHDAVVVVRGRDQRRRIAGRRRRLCSGE